MNDHRNIKACPRCGGRYIEIEDYDGDFVYIYCHDCEDSIEIPQKGARHPGASTPTASMTTTTKSK